MSFGAARAYQKLLDTLSGAEERSRAIAIKVEQENVKQQITSTKTRR